MACQYTLDWLDSLINISLNPTKSRLDADVITSDLVEEIKLRIEKEKLKYQRLLNDEVFCLLEKDKIEVLVNQYYSTLSILQDQSWHNQTEAVPSHPLLQPVYEALIYTLEELINFIEVRFSSYVNPDQRSPITHLLALKEHLNSFLTTDLPRLETKLNDELLTEIIRRTLNSSLMEVEKGLPIKLSHVRYLTGLMESLKYFSRQSNILCSKEEFKDLLIYQNFNSIAFSHFLTNHLKHKITICPDVSDKLEALLLFKKEFNQKHCKPGVALNPQEKDVRTMVNHWFKREIQYWKNKYRLSLMPEQATSGANSKKPEESSKVLFDLSVDQISLLLRAAADLHLIKARSLNAVFKKIVPHLSTSTKRDLSWDSMRSKSYAVEKRDKEVVIQALDRMIKKVKEY